MLLRAEIPTAYTISDARFREALNVNLHFSEVSDLSSRGHFVDLGQENTSVYAPSPETYFEKHRPPMASGGAARRGGGGDKPESPSGPREAPPTSHTPTRAGMK